MIIILYQFPSQSWKSFMIKLLLLLLLYYIFWVRCGKPGSPEGRPRHATASCQNNTAIVYTEAQKSALHDRTSSLTIVFVVVTVSFFSFVYLFLLSIYLSLSLSVSQPGAIIRGRLGVGARLAVNLIKKCQESLKDCISVRRTLDDERTDWHGAMSRELLNKRTAKARLLVYYYYYYTEISEK